MAPFNMQSLYLSALSLSRLMRGIYRIYHWMYTICVFLKAEMILVNAE